MSIQTQAVPQHGDDSEVVCSCCGSGLSNKRLCNDDCVWFVETDGVEYGPRCERHGGIDSGMAYFPAALRVEAHNGRRYLVQRCIDLFLGTGVSPVTVAKHSGEENSGGDNNESRNKFGE